MHRSSPGTATSSEGDTIELTGGGAIVRMLAASGVRHVFGLASGKLAPLFQAMAAEPRIDYMGVRHEAAAAFMATAIGARTGGLSVCLGETGPGGLNLLSGLGGAFANSLPVLAITSSNSTRLTAPDLGVFSSTDNARMFEPLTRWTAKASDGRRIPALMREAFRQATTGRPGPVHIDVPADVLATRYTYRVADLDAASDRYRSPPQVVPAAGPLAEVRALLEGAERPLVVAGGGLVASGGSAALRGLSERFGLPVVTTQMGLGALPSDHPNLVGQGGIVGGPAVLKALAEADVILALGCRFSSWMWTDGFRPWGSIDGQRLVQVDVDPAVIGRYLPVTTGFACDARLFLDALCADWLQGEPSSAAWIAALGDMRDGHRARLDALADDADARNGDPMHPATLARAIGRRLGTAGLAVFDGGHTTFWSNDFTPVAEPRSRFHEPGMTHLGFGLPWAIALKRREPHLPVWCITGDGAFGFTLQELDTARREGLAVVVVIHNNAAFGVIRHGQTRNGFALGADLADTNYAAIARGFGCFGERVSDPAELDAALARAEASGLPAVVDVCVSFEPHPIMPTFGKSSTVG